MARILVVDDDARARAATCAMLRARGHEAVPAESATDGAAMLREGPWDLLVSDVALQGADGVALARVAAGLSPPVRTVLVGLVEGICAAAAGKAHAEGVPLVGTLVKPVDGEALAGWLAGPVPPTRAEPLGEGPRGDARDLPPARALHAAARTQASGILDVQGPRVKARVGLKGGAVIYAEGIPGLLATVAPELPETPNLPMAVGLAVARGHDAVKVMEGAGRAVGAALAGWGGDPTLQVRWTGGWEPPRGCFPLATPTVTLLVQALRARPRPLTGGTLRARPPADSEDSRWGFDATATRALRACAGGIALEQAVAQLAGEPSRADEARATLSMLVELGFVAVEGAPPAENPAAAATPTTARPPEDPRAAELRQTLEALAKMEPLDALGLGNRLKVDETDAGAAFREASKTYHPDRFHDAPREVRALAEQCFAALNQAHETLASAGGLVDARRLIAARVAGVPYVDHRTHQQARAAFLRGEGAWRVRESATAAAAFAEAYAKDPHTYEHALMSALSGAVAGTLPAADALARVEPLLAAHPRQASRTLETLGQLLKLAGRAEDALARFREAVEKDPANHDAQRELRLHEKRAAEKAEEKKGFFAGLFGRKG